MLDPTLLESFLAVAQTRNFSEAGRRLGLRQSTVSQHVRKLEEAAGRRLFIRDTHSVVPTADGEAMVGFARSILDATERAQRYFAGSQVRGRVRFGASEDFVSSRLPELLRDFTQLHPLVDLELTVDLSASLHQMLDAGDLDLALCKRRTDDDRGQLVWRHRRNADRPRPAAAADPLHSAQHHARRGAGDARTRRTVLAYRMLQRQPERLAGGGTGRSWRDRARARADAGRTERNAGGASATGAWRSRVCRARHRTRHARCCGATDRRDPGEWRSAAAAGIASAHPALPSSCEVLPPRPG
jgi:DNA-binding transcriptional LysR family regulator